MYQRFRHRFIGPLLGAWLLLTIGGIAICGVVWDRLNRSLDASGEAAALENSLDQLSTAMQDAENSQRGYLLNGNESFLQPFRNTENSLATYFKQLSAAATQDKGLEGQLLELRGLAELKMTEMRAAIKLRREKGLKEVAAIFNSSREKEETDKMRQVMREMRQRRQTIFSSAWESTRQNLEWLQTTGQAVAFLGFGAGLFALYFVRVSFVQEQDRWKLLEEKTGAEKMAAEKSTFLANMSHEIRTPMNAILGFGELLEGENLTLQQAQYVSAIRESAASLLQLINDVLDLSKLEAGKLELHLESTDLKETFNFLQTMFGQQASMKGLQLGIESGSVPRTLLLDKIRVRQVLVNLVSNAIKFTMRGSVRLRSHWEPRGEDHGALVIYVEDTGVGLSPEEQKEIFKPYVQAMPERNLEQQGTGLGLSIVQRLTTAMGGTITLESAPGQGSLFRFELPDVVVSTGLPWADPQEQEKTVNFDDFLPSPILVADDNQANRELIAAMFEGTNHRLRFAVNGREVIARIAEVKPALVLMDLRMPIMDGLAALAEIRKRPHWQSLPVIALTASGTAAKERELHDRFSGHIRKPFTRKALYQELGVFLPRTAPKPETLVNGAAHRVASTEIVPVLRPANDQILNEEYAMKELNLLHANRWPALRDSLAINDTLAFAQRLRELGQAMRNGALTSYADRLASDAQTYAVGDLERGLAEFPALLNSLAKSRKKN